MSLLVVVPVIAPPRANVVESWTHPGMLVVINGTFDVWHDVTRGRFDVHTEHGPRNLGCPASWNVGFRHAEARGLDYVAIMSQSMMLHAGTATLAAEVERRADERGLLTVFDFHCIVVSVALWRRVGGFDESLPIWCDMDFTDRCAAGGADLERAPVARGLRGTTERCIALRTGHVSAELYESDKARYGERGGRRGVDGPQVAD